MTILNPTEFAARKAAHDALVAANLPDNDTGLVTPAKHREVELSMANLAQDLADSTENYSTGMGISAPISGISLTPTPVKFAQFDVFFGTESPIFTPATAASQAVTVKEPCTITGSFDLNGNWDNGDDLILELRAANGTILVPNTRRIEQNGEGSANDIDMHKEGNAVISQSPPWSLPAIPTTIELWMAADANLTLNLKYLTIALQYNIWSIRGV